MKEQYVLPFKKIRKKDVHLAGGKGGNLGEMVAANMPVPPGFVVLATAFNRFLEATDINVEIDAEWDRLNHKDLSSVERFSREMRGLITKARIPNEIRSEIQDAFTSLKSKYVAVRSSATAEDSDAASWAGELETYLYINQKNLIPTVKKCWSSLFTPRAIFYRHEKRLHTTQVSVAVVVQKMVHSETSGVCFTVHPVTKDRNQMVIEAGWGLGEAIVSGMITPDTYVIDKEDYTLLDINIAQQEKMIVRKKGYGTVTKKVPASQRNAQILTGKQIIELAKRCASIEKHYKKPQDIEWAFEKNRFYITQTRPITTL